MAEKPFVIKKQKLPFEGNNNDDVIIILLLLLSLIYL